MTSWLWFCYIYKDVKAGNGKKLIIQIKINKLLKKWIKIIMKIKNRLLEIKITYAKKKNKSILNIKKDFFNIPAKAFNISNLNTLQYLLKNFLKLRIMLSII